MTKKRTRKNKKQEKSRIKDALLYEAIGLLGLAFSCIAFISLGPVGYWLNEAGRFLVGDYTFLLFLGTITLSIYYIWKQKQPPFFTRRLIGVYLLVASVLLLSHLKLYETNSAQADWQNQSILYGTWVLFKSEWFNFNSNGQLGGGMIGALILTLFVRLFATLGTLFLAGIMIIISILLISGKSLRETLHSSLSFVKKGSSEVLQKQKEKRDERRREKELSQQDDDRPEDKDETPKKNETSPAQSEPIIHDFNDRGEERPVVRIQSQESSTASVPAESENKEQPSFPMAEMENQSYQLPSINLLNRPVGNSQNREKKHIADNVKVLEKTFESFGVRAQVKKVHLGPAVTRYEVYPDVGVKVSRIVSLSDDIALALAAKGIRIEAPIPGKSAVGIEVPNQDIAMVSLREVLDSSPAKNQVSKLSIGLGRDISGEPVLADLGKMPHLLVAGATGSGKSVCINGIITSLLMRTKPHEVKLLMVDPKMVELNVYNGIPHLLTPVVTDPKKASQALKKVVSEMERRYELFSSSGTRNLEGYNNYIQRYNSENDEQQPFMPYIVVIIDELADLMMVASKDVEDAITRLAQMARAAGIHLIIATQRPSVDVITGVIKANIPSRIAFSVSSQTDSRTILDSGGAEKLLGKGDMLFFPIGASKPLRVQGAFLSDEEVEKIVDFAISQQKAQYQENMMPTDEKVEDLQEVDDELYDDAVQLIVDMQTASVSMLQRRFRIGYTRAARLIDAMEMRHIVGPYEGSKPREVLIGKGDDDAATQ